MDMKLYEKLLKVQTTLKAPKDKYNSFGKFKYRSCEGILEAVKPILKENELVLTLTDTIENRGDRYYVVATATIWDGEGARLSVTAYAREQDTKGGMDAAQITGAASSYARKYALNALFLIDDNADPDTDADTADRPIDERHWKALQKAIKEHGLTPTAFLQSFGCSKPSDITYAIERNMIASLEKE